MRQVIGAVTLIGAVVLIIVTVGAILVGGRETVADRLVVPDNVPPAAAAPVDPSNPVEMQATATALRIPVDFLYAYVRGASVAAAEQPACNLAWNTLAGLGYSESHHGSYGVVNGKIIGPQLNGSGGFMEIPDTDDGRLDGDPDYDRAVGPLQFLPDSWRIYGAEGDPQNIADAAIAAGRLLCDQERDLATSMGWAKAIFAYNHSDEYLIGVRDAAANYALGQPAV